MKNSWPKQISLILISLIIITVTFGGGFYFGINSKPAIEKITTLEQKETDKPTTVDFSPFWKAWNTLNEKYVTSATTTSDQDKVWGAIEGLASSFNDPYTVFFPPEVSKMFQNEISGSFEGVGMEMGIKDNLLTVIAPLKDTPAAKAGILPGDKLIQIDDTVTTDMKVDQAIKMIRGKKGTDVRLTIIREGGKGPIEIKITRGIIAIPTIDTELKQSITKGKNNEIEKLGPEGVFVIRLYSFSATSPELFRDSLRKFIESGSDKLILDLRGNPGGYLESAVDMASWFLPAGKIIATEDFGKNNSPVVYRSKGYNIFNKNLKFAILIDNGSASASEILAGALRHYGIAKLVGTTTFGKGSVQELINITPETSLKVTVARWLTPDGSSISEKGVKPDLEVKITEDQIAKGVDAQLNEAAKMLSKQI